MLKNYFKVALRNIRKQSFYSSINIFGLAIGVASCLFILLYITDELSYDRFHQDPENIYRIGLHGRIAGQEINTASSCPPLAAALVAEIPGVESATRLNRRDNIVFKFEEKAFTEDRILFADSNFFQFFSFQLLEGDLLTALKEPNSVVLTPELAKKYFGDEAMGKLLTIGNQNQSFKVTGIAAEPPHNSHFTFAAIISTSSQKDYYNSPIWLNNGLYTYFRKNPATSNEAIAAKLTEVTDKHIAPEIEQFLGASVAKFRESGNEYGYVPYPMLDTHLRSGWQDDMEPGGNMAYVYVFGAVGLFILVIACINFMNLSTARSAGRAKEVGLRKTLGSVRSQMVGQFLAESTLYGLAAMVLAVALTFVLLPHFNLLSGKELSFATLVSPSFLLGALGLTLLIGLLAGSYPAFYLTAFNPVDVLRGKVRSGMKSKGIRSGLVVFQFALSVILIVCTIISYQQIQYLQSRNIGLDKHNVLVLSNTGRLGNNRKAFKDGLLAQNGITGVSYTNNIFPGVNNTTAFRSATARRDHVMGTYFADVDHAEVMKFELAQGRYFSKEFPSDSTAVVLNEAAVKELGWEKPLEEKLIVFDDGGNGGPVEVPMQVIGVVKDFNFESFKTQVRPMVLRLTDTDRNLLVRYDGDASGAMAQVEKLWKQYASGDPLEYSFLDQNFDALFREEQRLSRLFLVFTGLAIFIACLGLFALASFTAEQRTKEIGIRKAMGASVTGITGLLSREFTVLVLISILLAVFPAWYLMNRWLGQFAYRIDINIMVFVLSGVASLVIAWLTVAFQAFRAAMAKPVNSLRYE
ncbi:MAG: ABC transporter permease [Cyclobacteriaceae bacterium]|jgi:putative ABC transport system permease protein|nr:ABC transporter permease [Flammeovirgaceae bacterium]